MATGTGKLTKGFGGIALGILLLPLVQGFLDTVNTDSSALLELLVGFGPVIWMLAVTFAMFKLISD